MNIGEQATTHPESVGPSRSLLYFFLLWSLIIVLAVLSVDALKPPAPLPASAPQDEFSAARALSHVSRIARIPHPLGSAADAEVRDYLLAQLSQLGIQASIFSGIGIDPTAHLVIAGKVNDIVGKLPGASGGPAILLMAHYDSVYRASGAGDDAGGVAAILEILRAIHAGPPLQRDIIILFTDGEEAGLLGAEAFAHFHPWLKEVGLIMNFEGRGNRGPSLLFETGMNNRPLVEAVARVAPRPIGSSLFYEIYKSLPNDTDFTVFRPAGIPGLNFAFGEGLESYHSPLDTPQNLSPASLQHHGSYGLSLTRHFGQLDLTSLRNALGDDVFFDWFGSRMITYSQSWVLPGQVLITILWVFLLAMASRNPGFSKRGFLFALAACLAIPALMAGVAALGWWLLTVLLADHRIISDSPANLLLLSGLIFLSGCVGVATLSFLRKRLSSQLLPGALSLCWILSWPLVFYLPSGSYLLFWPLLLALLGNIASLVRRTKAATEWITGLPALAASILLFAPVIYLIYIFLTLQMIAVVASAILLGLLLLLSVQAFGLSAGVHRSWESGTLAAITVLLLVTGITLSRHTPEHPRPDSIVYSLNSDDNTAIWITYDQEIDDFTRQFLGTTLQQPHPVPNYLAGLARPMISSPAPAITLAPPLVENLEHTKNGDVHTLKLKVRSQRNAEVLILRFPEEIQPVSVKVAGRDVPVHKGGRFGLTVHAMGQQGVELEIAVTAPSTVSFWLMDRSYRLPVDKGPRPPNLMGIDGSDVSYVCRKYTL